MKQLNKEQPLSVATLLPSHCTGSWDPDGLKMVKEREKEALTLALMRVQCRELFSWS